jgi:hypothetical protein
MGPMPIPLLPMLALLAAPTPTIQELPTPPSHVRALALHIVGRGRTTAGGFIRQWPGTYFEAAFRGSDAYLKVGPGDVSLRIRVDAGPPAPLVKPGPGFYRLTGLGSGAHRVRVDIASESQAEPTVFGGIYVPAGKALPAPGPRERQIEFVGDSHTVGYGNTSETRDCTQDQVWQTTDTSLGLAPLAAARYDADYQVDAISGRGVVRNYNGAPGATLPQAYPFALLDQTHRNHERAWRPQVVVVALGTNDFSTPLHPGELWQTREQLHADYESSYVAFVGAIRARHPNAFIVLWSTDLIDGEIASEVAKVITTLEQGGEHRVAALTVHDLAMSGCHHHPSLADDARIADEIAGLLDGRNDVWRATGVRTRR